MVRRVTVGKGLGTNAVGRFGKELYALEAEFFYQ